MAATVIEPLNPIIPMTFKPMRVCFSYAAYAKNLINHLNSSNIPVEKGLSEPEFSALESSFNFTFPPDLRSILQEGLPIGQGFPHWRSSSKQQLEIQIDLPIIEICKQVTRNNLWLESWGDRPSDNDRAVNLARGFLKEAPILVPIYGKFYISSAPCMAGNPVFYVHGGEVKLWSFDIAGFFRRVEFRIENEEYLRLDAPPWAATEARRIEFWTDMTEARGITRGWWSGDLGGCLEEVFRRLRDGGWKEEDVREMMMMNGCDEFDNEDDDNSTNTDESFSKECVGWRVRLLSKRLLSAGWSREDVVDSLGIPDDFQNGVLDGDSWFDFHHSRSG
ncbi:unnamed protein product [Fraxinus pennsylvanica]|uniref:Knr4/Smi1-like domain-containing protein n=1 Tax=Fraxinus pennsylvanica TaxID=56036 RepID=A0AAD2A3A1_9LAMI|nr:unnamed protein product [Fraxinus pennsylvanica]